MNGDHLINGESSGSHNGEEGAQAQPAVFQKRKTPLDIDIATKSMESMESINFAQESSPTGTLIGTQSDFNMNLREESLNLQPHIQPGRQSSRQSRTGPLSLGKGLARLRPSAIMRMHNDKSATATFTPKGDFTQIKYRSKYIIDPDQATWLIYWDCCSMICLLTISVFTPYEAGFLHCTQPWDRRWIFNKVLTLFFACDFFLQFFLPYTKDTRYGQVFVFRRRAIIINYFQTWFTIDFVSIFPFDVLMPCEAERSGVSLGSLRAIRLLRLLKMLRLVRGYRLVKRFQTQSGFSFRRLSLYFIFSSIILVVHWMACILGIASRLQGDLCLSDSASPHLDPHCAVTWITQSTMKESSPWQLYILSLHTSMSILTHPHTQQPSGTGERYVFLLLLLVGGFIWTQVISRSTALISSMDRHRLSYQQTMDDINIVAADRHLSGDVQQRLRRFFFNANGTSQDDSWTSLLARMSPKLRRDVFREMHKHWVTKIHFLSKASITFNTDVAQALEQQCFCEEEHFGESFKLYMLSAGMAIRKRMTKVMGMGTVWGEEHMLLTNPELLPLNISMAISFVMCQVLARATFDRIVAMHPDHLRMIRRAVMKAAFIYGLRAYHRRNRVRRSTTVVTKSTSHSKGTSPDPALAEHMQDTMVHISRKNINVRLSANGVDAFKSADSAKAVPKETPPVTLNQVKDTVDELARTIENLVHRQDALEQGNVMLTKSVNTLVHALQQRERAPFPAKSHAPPRFRS